MKEKRGERKSSGEGLVGVEEELEGDGTEGTGCRKEPSGRVGDVSNIMPKF